MSRASNVEAKRRPHGPAKETAALLESSAAPQPRCTLRYPKQSVAEAAVAACVDSDWAGDPVMRHSTTGMLLLRGKHLLRHSSTVQA
eukprot:2062144-Amphidinium_carterae.1